MTLAKQKAVPGPPGRWTTALVMTGAAAVLMVAGVWADGLRARASEAEARATATATAALYANRLGSGVNRRLALVRGIAAFVTVELDKGDLYQEFPDYAQALRATVPGVRNIGLSPDFVVRMVHPLAGNERVVGHDLLKDPRPGFADTVRRAIATRDVTTHGPLPLIQGGTGVIARQAIFHNDALGGDAPWGAVGAVFDLQSILDEASLAALKPRYDYALRRADGAFVAGDPAVLGLAPEVERIQVPDGDWELAVAPAAGWLADDTGRPLLLAVMVLFGVLLETIIVLLAERRFALARLVDERTRQLDRKAMELALAKDELEQFAYAATHDLQEPVRTAGVYAQLLESHLGASLDEEGRELIRQVVDNSVRLRFLLHDVQLYIAEDRTRLPERPAPAGLALDRALTVLEGRLAASGATVACDPLPAVMADERRLKEIFLVLIGNAIVYRHPDRAPDIHIGARRDGDIDVLTVRDNGIGIEERHAGQIFKVFRRLHRREEHPGTGMGLAVARKMARRLGGDIAVRSTPGVGSEFSLRLPAPDPKLQP
jgi:signal transduction histidine kinase